MKFQMLNEEGNPETFDIIPIPSTLHLKNQTIEQCAQIADQDKESYLINHCIAAANVATEIARRIRALLTDPQPESPRNITQEQAVIAALFEACRLALAFLDSPVATGSHNVISEIQNALALADTLKKGESSQCEQS